jgi:Icc protein
LANRPSLENLAGLNKFKLNTAKKKCFTKLPNSINFKGIPMLNNRLIIAQVSDIHINSTDEPYRGIDVRRQFQRVLQQLATKKLDLLILSGDLAANDGEIEAYQWIQQTLTNFPHPYWLMAGNHDNVSTMQTVFTLTDQDIYEGMLCYHRQIKGKSIIVLDSSPYWIKPLQLKWLQQQLSELQEEILLFIHHPPLRCGCQFMDEHHALQNIEALWPILKPASQIKHIFCGHYHTEKQFTVNDKTIYLTPSTNFQIATNTPNFTIEHLQPGWRIIEWQNSQLFTYVDYL